jgi:transposase
VPAKAGVRTKSTTIAIDLAKSVFEVAVSHRPGRVAQRRRLSRTQLLNYFTQAPQATVLLEACGSAHHWARELQTLGHTVLLLPAHDVSRYRRGNKTDAAGAKALLEAHRNEEIRPVPVKSVDQQALTGLHRLRSRWLASRTSRINTVRGILRELGLFIPKGSRKVIPQVSQWLTEPDSKIPQPLRYALAEACEDIRLLERRIRSVETQLQTLGDQIPDVAHLRTVPGIGLLTSTALVAFVGHARRFPSGRHFASYLGITPRERSSGLTRRLGHISKHGDTYLRMLLIHGARAVLCHARRLENPDRLRRWALDLQRSRGHNVAAVALANKMARIAWAVWTRNQDYEEVRSKS